MRRKFDILFTFEIAHDMYLSRLPTDWQSGVYTDEERAMYYDRLIPEFSRITPTSATLQFMANHGILFKPAKNGGVVAIEKLFVDGQFILTKPTTRNIELSFSITLTDKSLVGQTVPFSRDTLPAEAELPYFSGIQRAMYFDNLDAVGNILADGLLTATAFAGNTDFGSLITNQFSVKPRFLGTEKISIDRKIPNSIPAEVTELTPVKRQAEGLFNTGAYTIRHLPGNNEELCFADDQLVGSDVLGTISIFLTPDMLSGTDHKYRIIFRKP